MVREMLPEIVSPLTYLVNRCLCKGVFSDVLKKPSSYRPSLMSVLSKVLDAATIDILLGN